jgi:hypothetical protein
MLGNQRIVQFPIRGRGEWLSLPPSLFAFGEVTPTALWFTEDNKSSANIKNRGSHISTPHVPSCHDNLAQEQHSVVILPKLMTLLRS